MGKTGHWDNYKDAMFTTSSENREYCIKPMNCPGHVQIFNQGLKSYRDLPLRMAEFGSCHRNEPSGALHGLMRVRGFTQDDAHIFCTEDQVRDEVNACIRMVYDMYSTFGFEKIVVKLSTRPEKRIGSDETWDRAEADLAVALEENNIPFEYQLGEGAFYGPKIEFTLYDCLDRAWQCGTVQLDFSAAAFKRLLCGRKQRASGAGHDSPCDSRFSGALHWHPDRRVRRLLPNLDCTSAGSGHEYYRFSG